MDASSLIPVDTEGGWKWEMATYPPELFRFYRKGFLCFKTSTPELSLVCEQVGGGEWAGADLLYSDCN